MAAPMPVIVMLKPCDWMPSASTGTRNPPKWTPIMEVAKALLRCRTNQLFTNEMIASHPPRLEPMVTRKKAA